MAQRSWREIIEVVAAVSVVGGLLLVAWEIRQANNIARAQTVLELSSAYNEINAARFSNPEVATLFLVLGIPTDYELSDVDRSMITGLAYHIHNVLWSAQVAYDNGLLTLDDLNIYRNDLEQSFEGMPAMTPALIMIYESQPGKQDAYVFEPLAIKSADMKLKSTSASQ
jgi:hypothetical protein